MTYKQDIEKFTLEENRHKYAVWCAATAAKARNKATHFTIKEAAEWLKDSGIYEISRSWESLPDPGEFDARHKTIRCNLINNAWNLNKTQITHGTAAKIINVYLKTIFVAGIETTCDKFKQENLEKLNAIHPPIDRAVLKKLFSIKLQPEHSSKPSMSWSKLTSAEYENIIARVRAVTRGQMWKLEALWPGHTQSATNKKSQNTSRTPRGLNG